MAPRKYEWLTVPNALTVLRLVLLIPLASMILSRQLGLGPLVIIMLWSGSDWLDGYLAREYGQTSRFGEILDPIADRLGIFVVTASLCYIGILPWVIPVVIGLTDISTALLAGRAAASGQIHVNMIGKARSAILFLGLVLLVASLSTLPDACPIAVMFIGVGTLLHLVAGVMYIREARRNTNHVASVIGRGVLG